MPHAKNKSDPGKNKTGFSSFWANLRGQTSLDPASNSDESVTFKISMKISVVTQKKAAGSLVLQGKSRKTGSFRLCDKEKA